MGCIIRTRLATTDSEIQQGLSGVEHLDDDEGMLFVAPGYIFWMHGMLIPLDMIWMDDAGVVVALIQNAQPCTPDYCPSFLPDVDFTYVLEVNAGFIERCGLRLGDELLGYITV